MDIGAFEANLKWRGIALKVFDTKEEAAAYLTASIKGKTVGFGGSMTLEEMGLYEKLKKENTVYWHWREEMTGDEAKAKADLADVYITSLNGVAETGELVNIDGGGNRVAATMTKHERLYFVIGALAVVVIGLGVYLYREETKPQGVEMTIGRDGLTIQEN